MRNAMKSAGRKTDCVNERLEKRRKKSVAEIKHCLKWERMKNREEKQK